MKGTKQDDGNFLLEDGVTILDAQAYEAQLTDEDRGITHEPVVKKEDQSDLLRMQNLILEERARALKAQLDALNKPELEKEPVKLNEGDIFNKPELLLERIQGMLDKQIEPLRKSDAEFKRQQAYGSLKQKFKAANPAAATAFAQLEPALDEMMSTLEPTESNFIASVQRVVGMAALSGGFSNGKTDTTTDTTTTAPTKKVDTSMPAHLRPSPIIKSTNGEDGKVDLSQFNENEKRLMRENKQSPAEYILFRDTPANEVGTTAFMTKLKKIREGK